MDRALNQFTLCYDFTVTNLGLLTDCLAFSTLAVILNMEAAAASHSLLGFAKFANKKVNLMSILN